MLIIFVFDARGQTELLIIFEFTATDVLIIFAFDVRSVPIIHAFDVRGQTDVLIIRNSVCFFNILLLLVCLLTLLVARALCEQIVV